MLKNIIIIVILQIHISTVLLYLHSPHNIIKLYNRVNSNTILDATLYNDNDSERLKKARLRLAEAQGLIPIGASALPDSSLESIEAAANPDSRVREISWRVAEPEIVYDPERAARKLFTQPVRWLGRNVQIFVPITLFALNVLGDIAFNQEEQRRVQRANELLRIITAQSPALIKAGQALASRSDLLPKEYLDALQLLQDRCPPYPTEEAIKLLEQELGAPFEDFFEIDSKESSLKPIAAASIGQVYKGRLRSNGAEVAIKIQRPKCEESCAVDLFVLRWYAERIQWVLQLLGRNVSLVSIIDDFGELLYRELDYRAEAVNAQRFSELYATFPDVFVPKVYTDLSSSRVLVMEWVDGARLNDEQSIDAMNLQRSRLIDTLVQCSLRQLLENGFFHADPHAGNLLAMPDGKLCYLDFGMVSYVEPAQRYSIIEAVVHMVNRDFVALAQLYVRMGFIPRDVDVAPIVVALENALPDVLSASVGDFNFKNVINKLGDVMYKFPFSLPPFYIAIIRCLGVLEGLAIQVDSNFRIISDAYPYIASRLLTDPSEELQSALRQLLFKEGEIRWDRLEELLEEASDINDYDLSQAVDQMVKYLISDEAKELREVIAVEVVEAFDKLESDSLSFLRQQSLKAATNLQSNPQSIANALFDFVRAVGTDNRGREDKRSGALVAAFDRLTDILVQQIETSAEESSSLLGLSRVISILRASEGLNTENFALLVRKVLREPVLQELLSRVISELSERLSVKTVRRIFGQGARIDSPEKKMRTV